MNIFLTLRRYSIIPNKYGFQSIHCISFLFAALSKSKNIFTKDKDIFTIINFFKASYMFSFTSEINISLMQIIRIYFTAIYNIIKAHII
jgi:hypothetical protein